MAETPDLRRALLVTASPFGLRRCAYCSRFTGTLRPIGRYTLAEALDLADKAQEPGEE
jgi:hypothetical protein